MAEPTVLELFRAKLPRKRYREQTGIVVKRSDGFYIRYYKDGDGNTRTKVTKRLCDLSTNDLGDHFKSGQRLSVQNRPTK